MPMPTKKRSEDWLTIKDFWTAGKLFQRGFVLSWFSPTAAIALGIAIPFCVGKVLASLTRPGSDPTHYVYLLIGFSIFTVAVNRLTFSAFMTWQARVMAYLQTKALTSLMNRGLSFHNNQVSGKLVSDALDYPSAFSQLSNGFFIDILPFLLIITIGILLVSLASPLIGLVLFSMTALSIGATIRFRRRMAPYRKKRQIANKAVTAHLADIIVNTMTVKSFGNETHELSSHRTLSDILLGSRLHDWGEVARDGNYRIVSLLTFEIIFVLIVTHEVHQNPALLATGIFAFSYTVTLSNRLFQIGTMMRNVEESLLLAAPMTEMLRQQTEIKDAAGANKLTVRAGRIVFENVSFAYQESANKTDIFTNLNLHIKAGEKLGLVGPSGGGKSTLTRLVLRFDDVQNGRITIDGQDIRDITQASLHQQIGYVPQEPLLFHRSVRENIAYGNLGASEKDVRDAARKAYALDFIDTLPNGLDTIVGERGVKLSGGQRQRVAIARAILKNAPILLLDEATSALDSESEKVIQKALQELMQSRTTIVIAHRLSTIQKMNRIILLNDGKIVEQGSHIELLKSKGLYARLWGHQSGGFMES
jgi:ATP-binding cassette subfamily B protein